MGARLDIHYSAEEGVPPAEPFLAANIGALREALLAFLGDVAEIGDEVDALEISLRAVSCDTIRELNQQYRSLDEPTDVLSFPLWEQEGLFSPPRGWSMLPLGDIVLCPAYIAKQAEEEKRDYNSELFLMAVHGALHLVGYDHDTPEKKSAMWALQEKIHAACVAE